MNAYLVMTLILGLAAADIGIGYNYRVPHTSYGVPSYQYSAASGSGTTGHYSHDIDHSSQSGYNANQGFGQQGAAHQTSYQPSRNVGTQYYQTGASSTGFNTGGNAGYPSYQFSGNAIQGGYQGFKQYQSQYQSSAVQKYQEYYNQLQEQPAQVFKHFYVHAAPEEPEAPRFRQPVALPPPQKHYKIIFIKTPTQPAPAPQYIPVPQQNEEKTIVYVLVKKPEEAQDIELPKIEQRPPAKPEVFFIKYNNKDDSQAVINNIVKDYNQGEQVSFSGANVASGGSVVSNTAQYDTPSTGSGHYSQSGTSGLYSTPVVSEQYATTGVGAGAGQFAHSTGGTFGSQSSGQVATGSYGTGEGAAGQAFSGAGVFGGETSGATSTANVNYDNVISTSQGVPHETYGPPTFRA